MLTKIYIDGTVEGRYVESIEEIVSACHTAPAMKYEAPKPRSAGEYNRIKWFLLQKSTECAFCDAPLNINQAILEYRIPLRRGGLDNAYNMILVCNECKEWRKGGHMPELMAKSDANINREFTERLARER